jgi:hypothetical protein
MKNEIEEQVYHKISSKPIPFKFYKDFVGDDDIIEAGFDEGYDNSDSAMLPHYYVNITRKRLETDEEYEKRLLKEKRDAKWAKERRYENYLKLKKEFDD